MKIKITALIEKELIDEIIRLSGGANITESITIALMEWKSTEILLQISQEIKKKPLKFKYTAAQLRKMNRNY